MSDTAENRLSKNKGLEYLQGLPGVLNSPKLSEAIKGYGSGALSLQDAIKAMHYDGSGRRKEVEGQIANLQKMISETEASGLAGEMSGASSELGSWKGQLGELQKKLHEINAAPEYEMASIAELFSNPLTASKAAAEQVRGNELFSGYFGEGGIQDQRQAEEKNLASRGYSLQPEDYEAYGQASDNIARLFGSQESMLAQSLANRGLAAAPSGAAAVSFSGLGGNKLESLAASQRQIAGDRMKMNFERLGTLREAVDSSNRLAQGAMESQRTSNQQGWENHRTTLKDAVSAGQVEQDQADKRFEQEQATKSPSFGEVLGGVGSLGLGAVTGGIAGGLGSSIATGLFGKEEQETPKMRPVGKNYLTP